jgi:hypothetical protein
MHPVLSLFEDVLSKDAQARLPALPRMIFVVHGALNIADRTLRDDEAWHGDEAVMLAAGEEGATVWRFELAPGDAASGIAAGPGVRSHEKLAAALETLPPGRLLLRGDSVSFPPGGCAYLHRHQGPGIRCLVEGGIRIDTHGRSTSYGPGGAWFESGPDPVFAQAAGRPTRFVRVMILPVSYVGKSSVEYLREEDKTRPKSQQYRIYADAPLAWESGR